MKSVILSPEMTAEKYESAIELKILAASNRAAYRDFLLKDDRRRQLMENAKETD